MQNVRYVADELRAQINSTKPLLITVFAALLLLLVGLRVAPEEGTPLMAKVMGLLCPTLATAGVGAYVGRALRGWLPAIGLLLLSIIGMFIIGALGASVIAFPLILGWGFINGMLVGPLVAYAIEDAGAPVVIEALTGTTAVMMLAGLVVFATGIDFSFLMPLLFLALMGLIVVGLVGIFVRFSRTVNLTYSILGMVIFAAYFLYDFFRVSRSENTWEAAVQLTMRLYIDFANFFIYLLQYLLSSRRR
ncbi:MAG: Bax inhibitor-1/YccA family protein [Chloracidobacterium sp.]|nr:Bax inhibitor-1/YccA family protein [Chloracidobacterium sp.]